MKNRQNNNNRPKDRKKPARRSSNTPSLSINLYGMHAVSAAWVNPKRHIHALYITNKALDEFDAALTMAIDRGIRRPAPTVMDKAELEAAMPRGSVHQGIGLNCQNLDEVGLGDIIRAEEPKERSVLVMLDQVTDPHNVGAIIRSSCAFGSGGMILQKKHAPELSGVLAKTACGGVEYVPVAYETNLSRAIESLQEAGYFVIGLAEEGEAELQALCDHQKLVLVLGAEGSGLRRLVREHCDGLVALPTAGPISSLNVSNAAAVALFAVN